MHDSPSMKAFVDVELATWAERCAGLPDYGIDASTQYSNDPNGDAIHDGERLRSLLGAPVGPGDGRLLRSPAERAAFRLNRARPRANRCIVTARRSPHAGMAAIERHDAVADPFGVTGLMELRECGSSAGVALRTVPVSVE
jgi:hypothetical protein